MDWRRAGRHVRDARARLGYTTTAEFAAALDVGETTVLDLELGRRTNFKASTLARVEAELGWPDDAIEVIAGGGPPPDVDIQLQLIINLWPRLSPGERAMIVAAVRAAVRPTSGA